MNYKKIVSVIGFLAIFGFLFNFATPTAKAMTAEEIIAQIQELQARIAQLQKQLEELQGKPVAWCHDFNTNLRYGDTGDDVEALQTALIKEGLLESARVSRTQGSFDEFTAAAVVKFQEKYIDDISNYAGYRIGGTGFVGAGTRAKLNELYGCKKKCAAENEFCGGIAGIQCCSGLMCQVEYKCTSGTKCPDSGGKCVKQATTTPTCTDSDGGVDYYTKGTVKYNGNQATDYCWKENILTEYSCRWDGTLKEENYTCTNGCSNGACLQTTTPSITVLSPRGGEIWYTGSTQTIKWTSTNIPTTHNILFIALENITRDEQYPVLYDVPNSGVATITVPSQLGEFQIKIETRYPIYPGQQIIGRSDGFIQVKQISTTTPSITVISPNGGESWTLGSSQVIKWSANYTISNIAISLVGQTSPYYNYTIVNNLSNTGSYTWNGSTDIYGTKVQTGTYKVRVLDAATSKYDDSDNYFSIVVTTPTCTDSDGGINYYVKGSLSLQNYPQAGYHTDASDYCSGTVLREVYCDPSGSVDGVNGYSQIFYNCPFGCQAGVCYYQKIADISENKTQYGPGETINLVIKGIEIDGNPASYENGWNVQYYTYSVSNPSSYLTEYLSSGNYNGRYSNGYWYADYWAPKTAGSYYTEVVLYCSREGTKCWNTYQQHGLEWKEKVYFSVGSPASSITVVSPNGGEKWVVGNTYDITWKASGTEKVHIDIAKFDTPSTAWTLVSDIPASSGKYSWAIGVAWPYLTAGDNYKIRVFTYPLPPSGGWVEGTNYDQSDNYFSIVAATPGSLSLVLDSSSPVAQSAGKGSTNFTFVTGKLSAGDSEDVKVSKIRIYAYKNGSTAIWAQAGEITNLKLYVDGVQIGQTMSTVSNAVADFTNLNLVVPKSSSKLLTVKADIPATTNATAFQLVIGGGVDLTATGVSSGSSITTMGSAVGNIMSVVLLSPCNNYGDLNGDGYVTQADVDKCNQCILQTLTGDICKRCDVNGDNVVDVFDITQLQRYISGLDTTFPVCQ